MDAEIRWVGGRSGGSNVTVSWGFAHPTMVMCSFIPVRLSLATYLGHLLMSSQRPQSSVMPDLSIDYTTYDFRNSWISVIFVVVSTSSIRFGLSIVSPEALEFLYWPLIQQGDNRRWCSRKVAVIQVRVWLDTLRTRRRICNTGRM